MATRLAKTPLLQVKRQLAAQAAAAIQQADVGATPAKVFYLALAINGPSIVIPELKGAAQPLF